MMIVKARIHPAIGIARLGNSSDQFFIGPEVPGSFHSGPFKDDRGRIKRQAALFRIYGYDEHDRLVGEITEHEAAIEWSVHVANHKAAWHEFDGLNANTPVRNADVADRRSLVIDPGPRSLAGPHRIATFDGGAFRGRKVPLGEARTDESGRLLVLGGFGTSASVPKGRRLETFANNDGWHDDVSDGPVAATVTLKGHSRPLPLLPSWVVCAPPDFAPAIPSVITLYDTLLHVAIDRGFLSAPAVPSFTRDVYPILSRAVSMMWVSKMVGTSHEMLVPAFGPGAPAELKHHIVHHLRDPALPFDEASEGDMPMLWGDYYEDGYSLALTPTQYDILTKWRDGHFVDDWKGHRPRQSAHITPDGLDRAALEACVGGAMYPGFEASWLLRDHYDLVEPFRLSHQGRAAGDVTKQMSVPWQADFNECEQDGEYGWWPSQRPDDVYPEDGGEQVPWKRELVDTNEDMVDRWHRLGFVVRKGDRFVEVERG